MWISLSPTCQFRERLVLLVLLISHVNVAFQQRDPVSNFCRRWGHQSAVVDDKLYISGGLVTYSGGSGTPENFSNPYLVYHDLNHVANSGMPQPYANLSKNSTIPEVSGAIFWPDDVNKYIYLFGGEFYDETPWEFSLYAYDIINDQWDNLGAPRSNDIVGLSYGAGVSIPSRGEAYYYGGWMNNATNPDWGDAPGVPTSYLLRYEMDTGAWTNSTGFDDVGRAEGVMVYIPAGDGGMLVYFGGIRSTGNDSWEGQPMDEIFLYDVLSGKSYPQNATGDVPDLRRRFCAGVTWAEDQSSYNIYLYGGAGEEEGSVGFDDIYILTLPTFTWIKMYPTDRNGTGNFPHHSFTCNVVNNAQMLVHGGFFPLNNACDVPDQWGLHDMDLGRQNKDKAPWALYDPDETKYVVPTDIISVVGGNKDGGATKTAPADGFMHDDLTALMTRKASVATRSPTRDIPSETGAGSSGSGDKLSTGAIAGIAVGGAVALIAALVGCFCLVRRYRSRNDRHGSQQPMTQPYDYHHPAHPSVSSNQYSPGPWSPHSSSFAPSSPPPFQSRPQTVQPHQGPPVELPSGNVNDMPHLSPYTETQSGVEPKYDAHGNLWVPQVSMMQIPDQRLSPGTPHYDGTMGSNSSKHDPGYFPSRTPQELATERGTPQIPGSPVHQTYYHP
ncbi:hypothetical protein FALBO_5772 [Fusarium albosuccineum]|uniref:Kelch repeat-containing protein n=1 Tax=Fusarium albosuccineum TaxID=1237068 RepID=A0A8H4P9I5_9HYPO|nr:hypothetical protein FALBO_5772 [Fusarium albosuccineum]